MSELRDGQKIQLAEVLRRIPEARWDRAVVAPTYIQVYGWLEREDMRADFLVVRLWLHPEDDTPSGAEFTTSSAALSESIHVRLFGEPGGHIPCERAEDIFGDLLPSAIRREAA
jgi:hypothetical protein